MRRLNWLRCLWPGLTRLGSRGEWPALLSAILFAGLLEMAVVRSFFWPEPLDPKGLKVIWLVLAAVWLAGLWSGYDDLAATARRFSDDQLQDLFIRAQNEYLRGNWWSAQGLLEQMLAVDRFDVEAQLMLASLYRHTGRLEPAKRRLRFLERLAGADSWRLEVELERKLLERLETRAADDATDQDDVPQEESTDVMRVRAA